MLVKNEKLPTRQILQGTMWRRILFYFEGGGSKETIDLFVVCFFAFNDNAKDENKNI
jgi:hypothetical protein